MKKILVPIDFSSDSINALEYAIALANSIGAEVRMIHVTKSKNFELPFYIENFDNIIGKSLEDFMNIIVNKYKGEVKNNFDYKIRIGKIYREIVNQAKYDDSSLIIMGTHGVSGFEEMWIGSNAYKVVSNASCPVITVSHGHLKKTIENIILPIDITPETRKKVPFIADFALVLNAKVHMLMVSETNSEDIISKLDSYGKQVEEYFTSKKIAFTSKKAISSNNTDATIAYAKELSADLIAIMTEQVSNPMNLWLGNYAQQMINHSPIPVISFRSHE